MSASRYVGLSAFLFASLVRVAPALACTSDSDCSGTTPICDSTTHDCRACGSALDCASFIGLPVCALTGTLAGECLACLSLHDCAGSQPLCDVTVGLCVSCLEDTDCGSAGTVCNAGACVAGCRGAGGNGCAVGETCTSTSVGVGVCLSIDGGLLPDGGVLGAHDSGASATCSSDSDCSGDTPICDSTTHECRACGSALDCAPFVGLPVCALTGTLAGECVACVSLHDCAGAKPLCDVTVGLCVTCLQDSDCGSDGVVCNAGLCIPGCRGTGGNGCPVGETCTSSSSTVGVCLGGDGGEVGDGGTGDGGTNGEGDGGAGSGDGGGKGSGDGGQGGSGDGGNQAGSGDGGGSSGGGDASLAGDGSSGGDGADGSTFGNGEGGMTTGDGSSNAFSDDGFAAGGGCSCDVGLSPPGGLATAIAAGLAAIASARRRRRGAR